MTKPSDRDARLAEALRANLRRRKAPARAGREEGEPGGAAPVAEGLGEAAGTPSAGSDTATGSRPNPAGKSA